MTKTLTKKEQAAQAEVITDIIDGLKRAAANADKVAPLFPKHTDVAAVVYYEAVFASLSGWVTTLAPELAAALDAAKVENREWRKAGIAGKAKQDDGGE